MRGWQETLLSMKTGSKWMIFVPPVLACARRQSCRIAPQSIFILKIELPGADKEADALKNESAQATKALVD